MTAFGLVEARITVRLRLDEVCHLDSVGGDDSGRRLRIKVEEVVYERDLLTGAEDLDVRGRPTTGRYRSAFDAGTLADAPAELRARWLDEARQIAAGLPDGPNPGGTTP